MTTTKMNVAAIVVVPSERLPQRGWTTPPAGGGGESNIHNNNICEGVDESTGAGGMFGSRPVYPIRVNHACMLTNIVVCPVSFVHTWEGEAQLILKIIVEVQGADLRRFDKHKKRATLWTLKIFVEAQEADLRRFDKHKKRATLGTGEYPPVMNCTLFAVHKALKYEWVIIPYHLVLYTKGVAE